MNFSNVSSAIMIGVYGVSLIKNLKGAIDALIWAKSGLTRIKRKFYQNHQNRHKVNKNSCDLDKNWAVIEDQNLFPSGKSVELAVDGDKQRKKENNQ